jgi:hypothetical protein
VPPFDEATAVSVALAVKTLLGLSDGSSPWSSRISHSSSGTAAQSALRGDEDYVEAAVQCTAG